MATIADLGKPSRQIELDGPITDMLEEAGLNWFARAMRGDEPLPEWLAKILENGPPQELPLVLGSQVAMMSNDGREYGNYMMTTLRTLDSMLDYDGNFENPITHRPTIEIQFAPMHETPKTS